MNCYLSLIIHPSYQRSHECNSVQIITDSDYNFTLLSYLAYFSNIMSKHDSSLSKDQFNLLKAFKKQISNPQSSAIAKQAESKKAQAAAEELEDTELFKKPFLGSNRSTIKILPIPKLCVVKKSMPKL